MKSFLKIHYSNFLRFGLLGLILLCTYNMDAQQIVFQVDGTGLYTSENSDCSSGPDPRWRARATTQYTGNFDWNTNADDIPGGGWTNSFNNANWVPNQTVNNNAVLNIQLDAWEEDPITCDNPCLFCTNGGPDDGDCFGYSTVYNVTMSNYAPCQFHTFEGFRNCTDDGVTITWGVRFSFYYEFADLFPGSISGDATYNECQDPITLLSTQTATAYATYQWEQSTDGGATWIPILGATAETYNPPPLSTTTQFRRRANDCSGRTRYTNTVTITIIPLPAAPVAANYGGCENIDVILSATGSGGTLNWYSDAAGTVFVGTGASINLGPLPNGSYIYYVGEDDGTCEGPLTPVSVSVTAAPPAPTAAGLKICPGNTATLSASGAGSTNFNWYTVYPLTTPVSTGSVFTTSGITGPTTFYVTGVNSNGCESDTTQVLVDIYNLSSPTVSGTTVICAGETTTLTATAASATGFNWYQNSDKTGFLLNGAALSTLPLAFTTTFYVAATYSNGCESLLTPVTVTVNQAPAAPLANGGNFCENEDVIVTAFATSGTLNWYDAASGGTLLSTGSSYNAGLQAAGTYVYYVEEDDGTCQSVRTAVLAVVNTAPTTPTVTSTTICEGSQGVLVATPSTGSIEWYADAALTNLLATGSVYTTPTLTTTTNYYVVEVSNTACRSVSATATVTVDPTPVDPVVSGSTICANSSATLTASGSGGTINWYADAAGTNLLGSGTTFVTAVITQNTTYYVQEVAASGCESNLVAVSVTANALPNTPSSASIVVCNGEDVIINATGSGTGDLLFYDNTMTLQSTVTMGGTPNQTYNAGALTAGNYVFYVSESDGICESNMATVGVTVNSLPAAPAAAGTTICSGTTATLTATGNVNWYTDAGLANMVSSANTYITPVLTASTDYFVVTTDANGCSSASTTVTVSVDPLPADPLGTGASICSGSTASISATGSGGTLNWYSDAAGSNMVGTGSSFVTPALTQNTTYFVQEVAASSCESNLVAVIVTVNALPNTPSSSAVVVCNGDDVIITATGSGSGDLLFYDNTMTLLSTIAMGGTATQSYNAGALASGNYVFYVSESDGTCQSNMATVGVTVNSLPAALVVAGTTICSGTTATLTASGNVSWYSDAGLSNMVSSANTFTTAVLTANTDYFVVATDANGCSSASTSVTVTVDPLPAAPVPTPDTVCEGASATLTATGSGGTLNWYSDPGGLNMVGTGTSLALAVVNQSTTYFVNETDAGTGCVSPMVSVTVEVNALPNPPSASDVVVCAGDAIILTATGSGTGDLVFYDNNNTELGRFTMSVGNETGTFNVGAQAVGNYVYFVAEDAGACLSNLQSINVEVRALPAAPSAFNDSPVCEGETVHLQANTTIGATYSWTGPNGFSSTLQNVTLSNVTTADTGTYLVAVTLNGCTSADGSTTVAVNARPVISGALSSNSPLCDYDNLNIIAPTLSGVSYEWTGPNGYSSNNQDVVINGVTEGDHQGFYTLVITDLNSGCTSLPLSELVMIASLPDAGMATNSGPACAGEEVQLAVQEVFGASYLWAGPNGFSSSIRNPIITPTDTGTYTVFVTVNNCQSVYETFVELHPSPVISVIPDTSVALGASIQLWASGGITYEWQPADYLDNAMIAMPTFQSSVAGSYSYDVITFNLFGCQDAAKTVVTVDPNLEPAFNIVNLFTPNGDGVNDYWSVDFLTDPATGPYTLQIMSRGGMEVLNTQNYQNDWYGQFEGKDLPDGTYWYIIYLESLDKTIKGPVTIKR